MANDRARGIRWEHHSQAELTKIEPDAVLADELSDGATWPICRDPTKGIMFARGGHVWCSLVRDVPKNRSVTFYYTFDDEYIYVISVTSELLHSNP